MASQTSALPDGSTLTKPAYTDSADIAVINTNMDKIVSNINAENQALSNKANNADALINRGVTVSDCNDTTLAPGCYKITTASANRPVSYGTLMVAIGNNYITQIAISITTNEMFFRSYESNAWHDWQVLALKINTSNFIGALQANESKSYHLGNASRTRIDIIGSNSANTNSYLVCTTNAGAVIPTSLGDASGLTVTTGTNTITITSTRYTEVFAQSIVGDLPYETT